MTPAGRASCCLGREGAERGVLGIDLEREAAIPEDDEVTGLVDLVDDAAIASTQSRFAAGIADELDSRAHADARPNSSQKVSCALWVHGPSIGACSIRSIPHLFRFRTPFGQEERPTVRRSRGGPADRPNSTA